MVIGKKDSRMIKQVGDTEIQLKHKATCHCGAVELEIDLPPQQVLFFVI